MLNDENPRVLHAGNNTRGPFPIAIDGAAISFSDQAHIRVTRFDASGSPSVLVNGTHFNFSALSALPDLGDPERPVSAASITLESDQDVLAEDEDHLLIERITPPIQGLALIFAGGFSSRSLELTLDEMVRVVQQLWHKITSRGISINALDPDGALELPSATNRAGKFLTFDDDGVPTATSASPGYGDLLAANNLSDIDDPATAAENIGAFQVANNLNEGDASAMRSNLGVWSIAQTQAELATKAALASSNVFTGALQTMRGRAHVDLGYVAFDLAAGVSGRGIIFDKGSLITIPAGKQIDAIRHDDTLQLGAGSIYHFAACNIATNGSNDAATDTRGFVANMLAGGAGVHTGAYFRCELTASGFAADLFPLKSSIKTRTGVGNAWNRQSANDTDLGGTVDGLEWATSQTATPTIADYTYYADTKWAVQIAHMFYCAVGVGHFLLEKNSLATVDQFLVDKDANMRLLGTLDLGNASDATGSRSSVGRWAIEGINIVLMSDVATSAETRARSVTNKFLSPSNLGDVASFRATMSANQTGIASATFTKVQFNTETWDVGAVYDQTTDYRWTPPAGKVRISVSALLQGLTANTMAQLHLYRNGVSYALSYMRDDGAGSAQPHLSVTATCNGTDYFEVFAYGTSGGTITVNASSAYTHFEGEQI